MIYRPTRAASEGHHELSLLNFDLYQTLAEVRREYFPSLAERKIEVWLQSQQTLANITNYEKAACIRLHSVLNHIQTPRPVIAYIFCHELTHLLVPPREVEGKLKSHPPEFWETECKLMGSNDRALARIWMKLAIGLHLRHDKKKECIFVKRSWKKTRHSSLTSWKDIVSLTLKDGSDVTEGEECCL